MEYKVRCTSCNKVSSADIETEVGDLSSQGFVVDPVDPKAHICMECKEWHEELMGDYAAKDDPYGWEEEFNDVFQLILETTEPANDNDPETIEIKDA